MKVTEGWRCTVESISREVHLETLEEIKSRESHGGVEMRAVESISNEVVQSWGRGGRGWRKGRGDIGASEKVGNKTTTQLGCVFVSMIRVAPAGTLRRRGRLEKLWKKVKFLMNDTPRRSRAVAEQRQRAETMSDREEV